MLVICYDGRYDDDDNYANVGDDDSGGVSDNLIGDYDDDVVDDGGLSKQECLGSLVN